MGMFDYIACDMPLPGTRPAWLRAGHPFQTKDTPSQGLQEYLITDSGQLMEGGSLLNFTGEVKFYDSNATGCHLGAVFTANGEDYESVEYLATFLNGKVISLTQTEYEIGPGLRPLDDRPFNPNQPTQEDREKLVVGREVFMLYGGDNTGYHAVIVAVSPDASQEDLCLRLLDRTGYRRPGDLSLARRSDLGRLLFLSKEDAFNNRNAHNTYLSNLKQKYDTQRRDWYARKGLPLPKNLILP